VLKDLLPIVSARYASLPLLGEILDGYREWMLKQGYQRSTLRVQFSKLPRLERCLLKQGVRWPSEITRSALETGWVALHRRDHILGGAIHSLQGYLQASGLLATPPTSPSSRTDSKLAVYRDYLRDVRGFSRKTVHDHVATAAGFLDHLGYEKAPAQIAAITSGDIEAFLRTAGTRLGRGALQHVVAHLRGFLRFLAVVGEIRPGLDKQIDTPRTYRLERLPRALPWSTVRALLASIDRATAIGVRDYTMLFLMATYGLRVSEIAALTLDDINWRNGCLSVPQRKTGRPMVLPLTDLAGSVLLRYLRRGRPCLCRRELFLRARAPAGPLKPTAVSMAFDTRCKRSGLVIPFHGAHCLRHSYATHLLQRGISLKAIGDLLGHRTAESTCVYLRLATEDLRGVALPVPTERNRGSGREARP
jgi:integrase/recombinase XerD